MIPVSRVQCRRSQRGSIVFRVVSGRKVRYSFREIRFGDDVKVLPVIIGIGDVKARGTEGERLGDLRDNLQLAKHILDSGRSLLQGQRQADTLLHSGR